MRCDDKWSVYVHQHHHLSLPVRFSCSYLSPVDSAPPLSLPRSSLFLSLSPECQIIISSSFLVVPSLSCFYYTRRMIIQQPSMQRDDGDDGGWMRKYDDRCRNDNSTEERRGNRDRMMTQYGSGEAHNQGEEDGSTEGGERRGGRREINDAVEAKGGGKRTKIGGKRGTPIRHTRTQMIAIHDQHV